MAKIIHNKEHLVESHTDVDETGRKNKSRLSWDATGSMWVMGNPEAEQMRETVVYGETIAVGDPVYLTGFDVGEDKVEVGKADASNPAKMPAVGVAIEAGVATNKKEVSTFGRLNNTNTVGLLIHDPLYVAPGGGMTPTRPIGTNEIQKIAEVTKVGASGNVYIFGAGRTNDVPNIPLNNFWLGDADAVATATNFDTEVSLNSDVTANSAHTAGDGTDHSGVATTELDNLGTTAINADLLPSGDNTRDIGATANKFKEVFAMDVFVEDQNGDDFGLKDVTTHQLEAFNELATTPFNITSATSLGVRTITANQAENEKLEFIIGEKRLEQATQVDMTKVHTGLEGTDASPKAVYTYFQNDGADAPELTASNANPNGGTSHVDGVYEIVGSIAGSVANIYATNNVKAAIHEKIEKMLDRFKEQGTLYSSGMAITADADSFAITSGTAKHVLDDAATPALEVDRVTPVDNQFTIEDDSTYTTYTDFQIDEYFDGVTVANGHHVKCRIGVVINNPELTSARFHIIPQNGSATYNTASQAWADLNGMAVATPRADIVKHAFVDVADIVIKNTTGTFTLVAHPDTGLFYSDVRGAAGTGGGGGGTASQNLYETVTGDTGSTTASSSTDSLAMVGGTGITTTTTNDQVSIAGDAATLTTAGIQENGTTAEIDAGTADRTMTPAQFKASNTATEKLVFPLSEYDTALEIADGTWGIPIDSSLNGYNIVDVHISVHTKGITGQTDIQIRRRRGAAEVDVLSTKVTLGDEFFASDGVVNASNDDLATGDLLYCDTDAIHSGTAPLGGTVVVTAQLP